MHQHDVDAKGLVREVAAQVDVLPELFGIHAAGRDESQGPRIGDSGRKIAGGDVCHAALDEGVLGLGDVRILGVLLTT